MANYRNSVAEINLRALKSNFELLETVFRKNNPQGQLIPMVKADAYGHGDIKVAQALASFQVPYFGVAMVEEGIHLRSGGIRTPILVFGQIDSVCAEAMLKYDLTPVLSHKSQIDILKNHVPENARLSVHVKINSGMQRLGFEPEEISAIGEILSKSHHLQVDGLCTHLVASEDPEKTGEQTTTFSEVQDLLKKILKQPFSAHVLNSGGILSEQSPKYDMARPGISLYGASPAQSLREKSKGLIPVMSLKSQLGFIHKVKRGKSVSYGGTWTASEDSVVGVVPLGYADGIPRSLSNKGYVLVQGKKAPIRGIVCMDYFMIDLTHHKNPRMGDEVVLIGEQEGVCITAEEVADVANTISYEILTGIQARVPRIYLE